MTEILQMRDLALKKKKSQFPSRVKIWIRAWLTLKSTFSPYSHHASQLLLLADDLTSMNKRLWTSPLPSYHSTCPRQRASPQRLLTPLSSWAQAPLPPGSSQPLGTSITLSIEFSSGRKRCTLSCYPLKWFLCPFPSLQHQTFMIQNAYTGESSNLTWIPGLHPLWECCTEKKKKSSIISFTPKM